MHIKFLRHGMGRAGRAAAYVLADQDHQGVDRAGVKVLRGDPGRVADVADSLDFVRGYSSAVIAWAPEDRPTPEQIDQVLDDFERLMLGGLEPDRIAWTAVQHTERNGAVHLHVLVARVDLVTGKAFNPAPPAWRGDYDFLRDHYNARYGWARPDDPARARLVQPGHEALVTAAALRAGLTPLGAKEAITAWLVKRIEAGLVHDRAGVVASLFALGEVTRQGENYVSVKPPGFDRAVRLKGVIYEAGFTRERWLGLPKQEARAEQREASSLDEEGARVARAKLEAAIARRARYNARRYMKPERVDQGNVVASGFEGEVFSRRVGLDQPPTPVAAPKVAVPDVATKTETVVSNSFRAIRWIDVWWDTFTSYIKKAGKIHERVRDILIGRIREIFRAIRGGHEASGRAELALAAASAGTGIAGGELDRVVEIVGRKADENVRRVKMRRDGELERFKREINFVVYAQHCGYEVDRRESSRASVVMRRGQDKIIVATDRDGHGIYFSVRDDRDNGSIIDFVQRRKKVNLGGVRKELRPWLHVHTDSAFGGGYHPKPEPSHSERQRVLAAWLRAKPQPETGHPYLLRHRGIDPHVLLDARFADTVRIDDRGNALFSHHDRVGICGYEIRNREFSGFSSGGRKGLWYSRNLSGSGRVVVVESAIDALSHAQLFSDGETAYVSLGGSMSSYQRELVRGLFTKAVARGAEIVIATDDDAGGHKLFVDLQALMPPGAKVIRQVPGAGVKDWNDLLLIEQQQRFKQQDLRGPTGLRPGMPPPQWDR